MIYSKLNARPPGDISRKSFPSSTRGASRIPPFCARVFDIIEIPKALGAGALQFRSVSHFLSPSHKAYFVHVLLSALLFALLVCNPSFPFAPYFVFVHTAMRQEIVKGGRTGKPGEPSNLTEARWDKIAPVVVGLVFLRFTLQLRLRCCREPPFSSCKHVPRCARMRFSRKCPRLVPDSIHAKKAPSFATLQ